MNIFIIIIMTLMFAAYQFFVAKRSADTVLNKDEMAFQIRLECLKQYHEYATSKNETSAEGDMMPAERPYTCTGAEDVEMRKFCLRGNKAELVDCGDTAWATICASEHDPVSAPCGYHCVATTMPYTDTGGNMPGNIKSLVFKEGFYMAEEVAGPTNPNKLNKMPIPVEQKDGAFGSVSCVQAERIFQQQKLASEACTSLGKFIGAMKDDGTFECLDAPPIAECTADEGDDSNNPTETPTFASGLSQTEACTQVAPSRYCCARAPNNAKCGTGFAQEWNKTRRHYVCSSNAATACKDDFGSVTMKTYIDSEPEVKKSDALTGNTYIPQKASSGYNSSGYNCIPNANTFTEQCKKNALEHPGLAFNATSNPYKYAFNKVEGLNKPFTSKAFKDEQITCHLTSAKSASATENCSACGVPVLDSENNWKCDYGETWKDNGCTGASPLGSCWNRAAYAASHLNARYFQGGDFSASTLQTGGCFKGCDAGMMAKISGGEINGENWGLVWRADSKIWECFKCVDQTHVNAACEKTFHAIANTDGKGGYKQLYDYSNCAQTRYSLCKIRDCNEDFQKMMPDGKCYTTWCMLTAEQKKPLDEGGLYDFSIGLNVGVNPNNPGSMNNRRCPGSHPTMLYNEPKDCVYCARVSPDIFEDV
ncbi:MAG: hypothetical protein LBI17_04075 [Rickettsiales bacterium]|jgi:hypothetical protein|nr:hypothetical protein [Rickettsiales bacterium]